MGWKAEWGDGGKDPQEGGMQAVPPESAQSPGNWGKEGGESTAGGLLQSW